MADPKATLRAVVTFTKRTIGKHAGKWTTGGRRGKVVPRLESAARHGKVLWTVTTSEETAERLDDGFAPAHTQTILTVCVEVPWRLSSERLTEDEQAKVLALVGEKVGEYVVVD